MRAKQLGPAAPDLNAYAERLVQTPRTECLDHFPVCGEKHLRHRVKEFVAHYHAERPHQARGNVPLPVAEAADVGEPPVLPFPSGEVGCHQRLGGFLKHYYCRHAA